MRLVSVELPGVTPDLQQRRSRTGPFRSRFPQAREDARSDARIQVVKYMGEELKIEGDRVLATAEAVVSGVKDSLGGRIRTDDIGIENLASLPCGIVKWIATAPKDSYNYF